MCYFDANINHSLLMILVKNYKTLKNIYRGNISRALCINDPFEIIAINRFIFIHSLVSQFLLCKSNKLLLFYSFFLRPIHSCGQNPYSVRWRGVGYPPNDPGAIHSRTKNWNTFSQHRLKKYLVRRIFTGQDMCFFFSLFPLDHSGCD